MGKERVKLIIQSYNYYIRIITWAKTPVSLITGPRARTSSGETVAGRSGPMLGRTRGFCENNYN